MSSISTFHHQIIILGAGVIGCNIAFELSKKGKDVLLVEKENSVALGTSSAAGGVFIYNRAIMRSLEWHEYASQGIQFQKRLENLLLQEPNIDINWNWVGRIELSRDSDEIELIKMKYKMECLDKKNVKWLYPDDVFNLTGISHYEGYINLDEGWVHPAKLIHQLYKTSKKYGAQFLFNYQAQKIEVSNEKFVITCNDKTILTSRYLVIAVGHELHNIVINGSINFELPKIIPVKGQALILKNTKVKFKNIICAEGLICVPREDGLYVGATKEENVYTPYNTVKTANLLHQLLKFIPELENHPLDDIQYLYGFRPKLANETPIIKEDDQIKNLFWAIGHQDKGIFLAPITASRIADLIDQKNLRSASL